MGTQKKEKIVSVAQLESKINFYITNGKSANRIKKILANVVEGDIITDSMISEIVDRVCGEHPNYDTIQKIMRSRLAMDKDLENSPVYVLDPVDMNLETINFVRMGRMFNKVDFSSKIRICKLDYRPDMHKVIFKEGKNIWTFNSYKPPTWYSDFFYSEGKTPIPVVKEVPKLYHEFLHHLVDGDMESYNYILDWMSNAIKSRNFCILCTIGAKGIGKGVLDGIMKKIVGSDNHSLTGNRILTSNFNSQLLNKKIVYCDEVFISNVKEEDRLKALINNYIEIEQKGVDAKEIRNYANIHLSSNNLDCIKLSGDNRRFSIVNLTEVPLLNIFSKDKINSLTDNPENILEFARYLYHREVDEDKMLKVFKSARTEEIRLASLTNWEEFILHKFCIKNKGKTFLINDIKEIIKEEFGFSFRPPGRRKLKDLEGRFPECFKVYPSRDEEGVMNHYIKFYKEGEYEQRKS